MTNKHEGPEAESDESKEKSSKAERDSAKRDPGAHHAPPTEAIILKSSD
ncbi:hypothetical protein ACFOYW_10270 [Gryllotalpicola reticulitermitis]|uniref:Uncharacterized protein n=1 Tax=Gryllotalpicola reticulitermitis TaxID=1184153 RepID=A0ABV8Q602_9MICO